jgi:hypothetical protein
LGRREATPHNKSFVREKSKHRKIRYFYANMKRVAIMKYQALLAVPLLLALNASADKPPKHHTSAKHDIGSGAGDVGKGAGKGAQHLAEGTGKAAVSLATLHPIDAAGHLGTGAAVAGKDVGIGAVKGTGKMVKGTAKAIKHIL